MAGQAGKLYLDVHRSLMLSRPTHRRGFTMLKITSEDQFDQLLAGNPVVVVEFYTTWCPDCHRVEKAYAEYAEAHKEQAVFANLNAEEVRPIAERFDVRGIPSFLVFRNGELVERLYSRDAKTVKQVTDFLDKALEVVAQS
jgi:thiol-disulfide isomerase/thioredoxin